MQSDHKFESILKQLENTNWKALGIHIYGRHEEIPEQFHDLFSEDDEIRREAIEFLMGGGQDYGSVYDTTPQIVFFLLEILKANYYHPELILEFLSAVCRYRSHGDASIPQMRHYIQIYETLGTEIQLYYKFLSNKESQVRVNAASLLGCFSDKAETIADWLRNRYAVELDTKVKQALIWALRSLIENLDFIDKSKRPLVDKYKAFFLDVAASTDNIRLKTEAAQAFLALYRSMYQQDPIPHHIINALVEGFLSDEEEIDNIDKQEYLRYLSMMPAQHWLPFLDIKKFPPKEAHLIVKAVLVSFAIRNTLQDDLWYKWHKDENSLIYRALYLTSEYYRSTERIEILKTIADYDAFWELPTNLLSLFAGLPDSREDLRKFIEANPPFVSPS